MTERMPRSKGRVGRPWLRLAAAVRARRDPCWLCGYAIDYDLPARHPLSFSVDHVVPLSQGGFPRDPDNLRAAHYGCNARRGDGANPSRLTASVTSRRW